ncbi:MAG TPA: acetate--CoA ligase family protein [Pseudonocardiaceae bacterium]|nr:acetate--CoA ligase family protein [Pseudonocardiaceae bacterium]
MTDLHTLLAPRSIVVVGASDRGDKPGARITRVLVDSGFRGPIYGVNPRRIDVPGVQWLPTVDDLPEVPDLACIAVPAEPAVEALERLAPRGLPAAVVYSSGFSESDDRGRELERRLVAIARRHGVALCGPNTAGYVNMAGGFIGSFTHALAEGHPDPGVAMVITQSGAVGGILLTHMRERRIGVSSWISVGNGGLLDVPDYLEFAADDPATKVVCLFLEGLKDGPRFLRAAARCRAAGKTIVAYKAGTSESGSRAAASHTGNLAGSDAAYDGAFAQVGVIRAHSIRELVDITQLASWCGTDIGRRGVAVSVSGAGCTVLADEFDRTGLALVDLGAATVARLAGVLPTYSQQANPVDLTGSVLEDVTRLQEVIRAIVADESVDFMILSFATNNRTDIAAAIDEAWDRDKPLLVVLPVAETSAMAMHQPLTAARIPVYRDLRDAVTALAAIAPASLDAAAHVPVPADEGWLIGSAALAVLAAAEVPVAAGERARDADEARAIAERFGARAVLKLDHPAALHKTELGGVRVGIAPSDIPDACRQMVLAVEATGVEFAPLGGFIVQELLSDGVEVLVGISPDDTFGQLLTVGLGGTEVELFREVASRVMPASADDIRAAVGQTVLGRMLRSGRTGQGDLDALVELVLRFQEFVAGRPDIVEAELNPVMVRAVGKGAVAVDARVRTS